jgi:glutamate-ammonia-ligase adenylyltransferase
MDEMNLPKSYLSLSDEEQVTLNRILRRLRSDKSTAPTIESFLPELLSALGETADPLGSLIDFERFINHFEDKAAIMDRLRINPRSIEILGRIFSNSHYLSEILLQNVQAFIPLIDRRALSKQKSSDQIFDDILTAVSNVEGYTQKINLVRQMQVGELLRIGVSDLLDFYDLWAVTRQLSNLADAIIRICLKIAAEALQEDPNLISVIGMGKLGGRELNYSSDIDLILVSEADPETCKKLGEKLIDALGRMTDYGFLYRVDMRLRPWGSVGPLVNSLDGYLKYLLKNARHWEKQALLKARVIAGNLSIGQRMLDQAQPFITAGEKSELREAVDQLRLMTEAELRKNGIEWGEVKLGLGSIRDIEFTVQFFQMAYGAAYPEVVCPNTMESLRRLSQAKIISVDEYRILSEGYIFQRTMEHFLQILDYRQTHTLPTDKHELDVLARRLGFSGDNPGDFLTQRYEQHSAAIRDVYLKRVRIGTSQNKPQPADAGTGSAPDLIKSHLDRMTSSYEELFSAQEISLHAEMAHRINRSNPAEFTIQPEADGGWKVTIAAYDFAGEISVITGLFFIYGLDILSGEAFTYKPVENESYSTSKNDFTRKIIDVFYVTPISGINFSQTDWDAYHQDFIRFHQMVHDNKRSEVFLELSRRFAARMGQLQPEPASDVPALLPIELQIDNDSAYTETILRISGTDTIGFLFELTNALALTGIYINRVMVESSGSRIHDVLFVTDSWGRKILDRDKLQELRSATVLIKHFTHLLPYSPNPESAILHFRDFIGQFFKTPEWNHKLVSIEQADVLQALAKVLGVSDFLWDDFLRMQYTNLFPVVTNIEALQDKKSKQQLSQEVNDELLDLYDIHPTENLFHDCIEVVNAWRDREMLRVDMRHLLGILPEFWDFAAELTDLAEVIVNCIYRLCLEELTRQYGKPCREDGAPSQMSVVALGKFGGSEMGFASDVEMMFVYDDNGKTTGPEQITTAEFYEKLVEMFSASMHARREGIFQIDLQLRPYGKMGNLAVSLDAFKKYYQVGGPAWSYERQSLIRLRHVAGSKDLGRELQDLRDSYLYTGQPFDAVSMWAMRERQLRHLVKAGVYNLKYSLGGLVDLEYLVQGLQITNGAAYPQVRHPNTRVAMAELAKCGLLNNEDYTNMRKAHTFLRWMIDSLRVVRGNAKDVNVPDRDSDELAYLARRMHYGENVNALLDDLEKYQILVQETNIRLLKYNKNGIQPGQGMVPENIE